MAPRTSLVGLQSTVTALPCTDYNTEELDWLLVLTIFYYNTDGATLQPTTWPAQPPTKVSAGSISYDTWFVLSHRLFTKPNTGKELNFCQMYHVMAEWQDEKCQRPKWLLLPNEWNESLVSKYTDHWSTEWPNWPEPTGACTTQLYRSVITN